MIYKLIKCYTCTARELLLLQENFLESVICCFHETALYGFIG